jgi:hypothetical protein
MKVPTEGGELPWGYFLFTGSLTMYHADLQVKGPEYKDIGMIYWPKQYQSVTHIYLSEKTVALGIY